MACACVCVTSGMVNCRDRGRDGMGRRGLGLCVVLGLIMLQCDRAGEADLPPGAAVSQTRIQPPTSLHTPDTELAASVRIARSCTCTASEELELSVRFTLSCSARTICRGRGAAGT